MRCRIRRAAFHGVVIDARNLEQRIEARLAILTVLDFGEVDGVVELSHRPAELNASLLGVGKRRAGASRAAIMSSRMNGLIIALSPENECDSSWSVRVGSRLRDGHGWPPEASHRCGISLFKSTPSARSTGCLRLGCSEVVRRESRCKPAAPRTTNSSEGPFPHVSYATGWSMIAMRTERGAAGGIDPIAGEATVIMPANARESTRSWKRKLRTSATEVLQW